MEMEKLTVTIMQGYITLEVTSAKYQSVIMHTTEYLKSAGMKQNNENNKLLTTYVHWY